MEAESDDRARGVVKVWRRAHESRLGASAATLGACPLRPHLAYDVCLFVVLDAGIILRVIFFFFLSVK